MTPADVLTRMVQLLRADHDPRCELEELLLVADRVLATVLAHRLTGPTGRPVISHGPKLPSRGGR